MWASAPTNDREKSPDFEGGQGRPPLQVTVKNNDSISSAPTNGVEKHWILKGRTESSAPTNGVENHAGRAKSRRVSNFVP